MNISQSLVSRRSSAIIKGLLILLIVLGHNGILMGKAPGLTKNAFNDYLYSFHVYLFLILPFFYNIPQSSIGRIKKDFLKLYKPYTIIFVLLLITNVFLLKSTFEPVATIFTYISGDMTMLKDNVGASFPWFLPTMFSLLVLRNIFLGGNKKVLLAAAVALSAIMFIIVRVAMIYGLYRLSYLICGSSVAIAYFSLAVASRYIYEKFSTHRYFGAISIGAFIVATIAFFTDAIVNVYLSNIMQWVVLPVSGMYTIMIFADNLRESKLSRCLEWLGNESLAIYMVHVFIYNVLLIIVMKLGFALDFYSGCVTLLLTIVITLAIIQLSKKTKLYNIIFK